MDGIPSEIMEFVKQFYQHDDVSHMCLRKRDVIIVRDELGKRKLQKRHMSMSINEAYALFKD